VCISRHPLHAHLWAYHCLVYKNCPMHLWRKHTLLLKGQWYKMVGSKNPCFYDRIISYTVHKWHSSFTNKNPAVVFSDFWLLFRFWLCIMWIWKVKQNLRRLNWKRFSVFSLVSCENYIIGAQNFQNPLRVSKFFLEIGLCWYYKIRIFTLVPKM
jgi:hypothetical protein